MVLRDGRAKAGHGQETGNVVGVRRWWKGLETYSTFLHNKNQGSMQSTRSQLKDETHSI